MITWLKGEVVDKKKWCTDLYSIKIKTESLPFIAGQFVIVGLKHDGAMIHKPYSLVNAPDDEFLEIHLNTVQDGKFSPLLTNVVKGDTVYISNKPSGLLTLDEVPSGVENLWLWATGTGIGPFLSILHTPQPWQRFKNVIVCYSTKTAAEMAYRDDFEALLKRYPTQFHFLPFITREQASQAIHSRITSFLSSGELEKQVGLTLTPDSDHVMLCGNSNMLEDASHILEQKGLRRHSRHEPGNIAIEKYF